MKIKICGLFRDEDIDFANAARPDYIGFVFFEKSRRFVSLERAEQLKSRLDKNIRSVGVFVDESMDSMVQYCLSGAVDVIQLHGHEDNAYISALREITDKEIWQAFKIRGEEDIKKANDSSADMLVLDNGMGTGKTFDWSLIKNIKRPFFLAGGINCENIGEATKLAPYGIDVSSGVETDKAKDKTKIEFIVGQCRVRSGD